MLSELGEVAYYSKQASQPEDGNGLLYCRVLNSLAKFISLSLFVPLCIAVQVFCVSM